MTEQKPESLEQYWFKLGWEGCKIYKGKDFDEAFQIIDATQTQFRMTTTRRDTLLEVILLLEETASYGSQDLDSVIQEIREMAEE